MAYEQRARNAPSQPDNFLDPTKKNLNPWQDKSANNYLSGYHGSVVYQQPPVSPQLDPMLQETDDGWSEWPDDWDVEDSDIQCMSNGFSNGFNNQSPYSQQQQHQITSQHQPQNFGHFFDQVPTPNQQQVPQPKVESAPPNSFFDNIHLNNSTGSTPTSTAHLFSQDPMAATLRTGVSYAAALSGNAETAEQNNGGFDDINLNDNTDTGFNEEDPFTQPEPALPAASFSPFPMPAHDKMERSAAHLFSAPATAVSGASHNDLFGSAAEASLENDDDFGDKRTSFDQEQQQKGGIGHANVQESFSVSQPPPAMEEQRPPQMGSKESEGPTSSAFEVHRPPAINDIGHTNIEDAFASSEPFTFPAQKQKQPDIPSTESEETMDNAFDVHRASSNDVVPHNIEDSFASNQPFTYPTHKKMQPEMPLQPEATGDVIEEQSEPSNESVPQGIEDSFASNQPFIYPSQQKQPELAVQGNEKTDGSNFGVRSVPSEEGLHPEVEDSFANQEQRQPEVGTEGSEEAGNIHEDLHSERSQDSFFAPEAPSQSSDIDEGLLGQTIEQPNQVVRDMEDPFAVEQPAFVVEDQQPPEDYSQYPYSGDNIQDRFGLESSSYDGHNEPTESVNEMAWEHGESMSAPGEQFQDGQQDHMASLDTAPWQHTDQEASLSYPSELVTGKEPNISMPDVSPDTSESDSSVSSHDTSSNSDQSQIETAAWREEEVTSYDKYSQPPTASLITQPITRGQRENDVPSGEFYEQEQSTMEIANAHFHPPPPPGNIGQPSKVEHSVPENDFFQHEQHSPPTAIVPPPPLSAGVKEVDVPKASGHEFFQPGPPPTSMVHPVSKIQEDVSVSKSNSQEFFQPGPAQKSSSQTIFHPGPPPTNMVQQPPAGVKEVDVPKTGVQGYFQPGPPPTQMVQPPPMTGNKTQESTPNTGTHKYFHPGPPPTQMVQPPPITGSNMEENTPSNGTHKYFQSGPPSTSMVQTPSISKIQEDVSKSNSQEFFQPGPPPTNMVPSLPVTGSKMEENTPNTGTHKYFQPGPPPTQMVQPPPITGNKMEENTPNTGTHKYFQPEPPPTQMVQPPPITGNKMEENTPNTGTLKYFQPGPPPTQMVQPPPITGSKMKENTPNTGTHKYFQPGPPTPNIVQPSHEATDKAEDVPKRGGHKYFQPGPPPTSIGQPHPTTAVKTVTSIPPSKLSVQEQSAPPTGTMQSPSMIVGKTKEHYQPPPNMVPPFAVDSLKKPIHEHSQPAPATSSAPPVLMYTPKAGQMETSTPEPQMLPESGPMAMTKRPIREEKSRTPVSLSSSLWSTDVPTAMAPAIMLAPALQPSPKPAAPTPAAPETLQPKQELNNPQSLSSNQEIKADSLASLSKKERKAEKKRLKALKKEQKKLKQESKTPVEDPLPPKQVQTLHHSLPTNPSADSSFHHTSKEDQPVEHFYVMQEKGHHESEREYHPRESGYQGKSVGIDEHEVVVAHRGEHRSHYDEHVEEKRHSRHRNIEEDYYSNPRVRELREESPSRLSRQQDYTHRHDDHDLYHDHYSGSHGLRRSRDDLNDRSFRGREHYDDSWHNISREYDDHHDSRYSSDHDDNRYDRDYRYTRDRRDTDGYRNYDRDHYKRGQTRADEHDYYSSRRSHDEHYLDRSFDSQYDRGRPEHSSREELDSYRGDRDSANRGIFKPINDPHYGEYKDSYRSTTPSSSSGRSTPPGYEYMHDQYYGYQHPQHPYPGYDPHYGYYPGPYGMPYHYPPPGYYPGYGLYFDYYHQYGGFGSAQGSQYSSGEGSYPENQANEGPQASESALEKDQEEGEVQEVTPLRTTPLHFLRPHVTCRFGPAGKLLVTLPHHPADGQKPLVQVSTLKAIFSIKEREQIEAFPGPLSCRGTMKRQVIEYIQAKADEIQESSTDLARQQANWVLWKFLLSLIKHNGAIVAEDIAEMLMMSVQHFEKKKKKTTRMKRKRHQSEESNSSDSSSDDNDSSDDSSSDSSDDEASSAEDNASKPPDHLLVFRALLLEGKTKEALDYAMNNSLWAHAVLLGGLMDTKVNSSLLDSKNSSSIISSFFMTLEEEDPLKTVYEHLGGKVPHAVKHHTNWASNLAGIVANPTSFPEKDKENIITLGDTLAKHPDLVMASHLCYLLAGLRPGTPGTNCKMVLIGCEHRSKKCDKIESLDALQLTELFEYASSLENPEFFLPSLQMFRYFYATKLVVAGYHKEALAYLQFIGDLMMKHPHSFNETMKKNVYRTTEQLVGYMEQAGTSVELFVLTWLKKFNNVLEGKDSGISLPQQESETEDDEDPMAQSSVSYFSGYEHPPAQEEESSPESTPYTHNTVSRQASLQSTHSVPSVHSLQTLDLSQPVPTEIYQPNEPVEHKDSVSSLGYQDQADGQEYQIRQPMESVDPWQQQQQQQFGNDLWMPGVAQQNNSWIPPTRVEETGRGTSPEDGETTPVNASQTFDDFYLQANPMRTGIGATWGDESAKTPTLSPSESSLPSKEATESRDKEEKADTKAADKNKQAQSSGFWNGITGLVKTLIPKGPKEVHLPDDKNKTIYFDKELDKWINTDESEEDRAPPPPPPTDAMIGGMSGAPSLGPRPAGNPGIPGNPMVGASPGMMPPNPTIPAPGKMNTQTEAVPDNSRGGPGAPAGPGSTGNSQQPLPGMLPGMQTKPAGPPSKFSRKAQGRLGSRNKYVDVLNPNKGSQSSSQAVPSALFPVMPTGGSTFQGTLFVPSAAPVDNDADNSSSQPPTDIQSGQGNPQPPSPTEQEGEQLQKAPPQQPTFFDPSSFQPQPQSHSMARRGRGRYPGGYNK